MEIMQLLGAVELYHFGQTYDISLGWIGAIIQWLVAGIGIVGVGIIVFSLILKLIVLPFDVYQRITMRKQNNKMKENQERMEKLQKQYANDKEKYNQKVMEMYKENGISMFSSCLPMILSMIVFIAAIGGFNAYSKYANIQNYNHFVQAYNQTIEGFAPEFNADTVSYDAATQKVIVREAGNPVYMEVPVNFDASTATDAELIAYVESVQAYTEKDANLNLVRASYIVDEATFFAQNTQYTSGTETENTATITNHYYEYAREAVREEYEAHSQERVGFLWVKNVWNVDASYEHPITEYSKLMVPVKNLFTAESAFDVNGQKVSFNDMTKYNMSPYSADGYEEVTKNLTHGKESANGYFILIALSIGTILLQQFISMRSQKEQNQFSSVDGQQASTQKTTMIIMTVMFGIFSFMYSAAFSIYMVVSSIFSLLSTMVINKVVDARMSKQEEKAMLAKYTRKLPGQKDPETKKRK